jgi:hypothetical protein
MIRELREMFQKAVEQDEGKRKNWKYWLRIYRRFLDLHEQRLVEFALERWEVKGLTNPVIEVEINSFTDKNEVYHLTHLMKPKEVSEEQLEVEE